MLAEYFNDRAEATFANLNTIGTAYRRDSAAVPDIKTSSDRLRDSRDSTCSSTSMLRFLASLMMASRIMPGSAEEMFITTTVTARENIYSTY